MQKLKRRIMQFKIIIKYCIVYLYCFLFRKKSNDVWLISERGDEARDNGFAFYQYLKKNHSELNVKYVITKNSPDFCKIQLNDVVPYQSFYHIYLFITSKYLISTHLQGTSPEFRSFTKLSRKGLIHVRGKQIFLQHGITKDLITPMLKKNNPNLDLLICGAKPEYDFISKNYGYDYKQVRYTGFARFDTLVSKPDKMILLMPTWRDYLYKLSEQEFKKSEYFKRYNNLINDARVGDYLKSTGYRLVFYPHYEIQKYIHCFHSSLENVIIADFAHFDVQQLLRTANILITDYSSVYFDFAYMKKPVVYYHFDYQKYRATQYSVGYFDYERDGFGVVCNTLEDVLSELTNIADNHFKISQFYLNRTNGFFELNDSKNCERIYHEILKLS